MLVCILLLNYRNASSSAKQAADAEFKGRLNDLRDEHNRVLDAVKKDAATKEAPLRELLDDSNRELLSVRDGLTATQLGIEYFSFSVNLNNNHSISIKICKF